MRLPGRRVTVAGIALVAALAVAPVVADPAVAHSLLVSSEPAPGSTLTTPPTQVVLEFSEQPDPGLSSIKVLGTSGASVTAGPVEAVPGQPFRLRVPLATIGTGVYTVAWRSVSSTDGHTAAGSFAFGLGVAPGAAGQLEVEGGATGPPAAFPLAVIGRWLLYLGLMGLLGAAFFGGVVARGQVLVAPRLIPGALVVAALGTVLVAGAQLAAAEIDPGRLLGSTLGASILARLAGLALAWLGTLIVGRLGRRSLTGLLVVGLGATAAMVVDVVNSHAGADLPVGVAVQAIHILAAGLWLGGLVALLVSLRSAPGDVSAIVVRRFSTLATVGIAAVAVTGLARGLAEVGSLDGLVGTDFGRLVMAKSALLVALAGLAAVNRFRNVPVAARALRGLRRVGSAEVLVGLTIVLLAAGLVNVPPAVEVKAAVPGPATGSPPARTVVEGSDFGTSVRLRLEVTPGAAGFNDFQASVTDFDTGAPLAATSVSLRFSLPARPDVGASQLELVPAGDGRYAASSANLSLDGAWTVVATVAQARASVEVPLKVLTRTPATAIEVNAVPGLPTISTVHLPSGASVQVYLDPGKAGPNELHVTFFDAGGGELAVPAVDLSFGPSGQPRAVLTGRKLGPGHWVADVRAAAGNGTLALSANAPAGGPVNALLDLEVSP